MPNPAAWLYPLLFGWVLLSAGIPARAVAPALGNDIDVQEEREVMQRLKRLSLEQLSQVTLEYKVKAGYIFKFIQYVNWPAQKFTADDSPFQVCVVGKNPFGRTLDPLRQRQVRNRAIELVYLGATDTLPTTCHIAFISYSAREALPTLLEHSRRHQILAVSDIRQFAAQGGMIGFIIGDGNIHLEINLVSTHQAGLTVHQELRTFKFARMIRPAQPVE